MYRQKKWKRILAISFIFSFVLLLITSVLINQFAEKKSYFEYTEDDVKMLGDFMEANIMCAKQYVSLDNEDVETLKHMYMLVGSVVLHRLEARYWGETMKQVIYAPGQYDEVLYNREIMENIDTHPEVYKWAEELLRNGPEGPEGLIYERWFNWGYDEPYQEVCGMYFYVEEGIKKIVEGGTVN